MSAYRDGEPQRPVDPDEEDARESLRIHLHRDETLLWAGRPMRGLLFRGTGVRVSFVGCAICLSALYVLVLQARQFPLDEVRNTATLVLLFGLALVLAPFLFDARVRARTFYGLTERRVLVVITTGRLPSLTQFDLRRTTFALWERPDGSGTISLELPEEDLARALGTPTGQRNPNGDESVLPPPTDGGGTAPPALRRLANAKDVFVRIGETKTRLASP
ncbi:MAG TPA: hypothetical protein VF407_00590 [Polyangiaceae bacterium]